MRSHEVVRQFVPLEGTGAKPVYIQQVSESIAFRYLSILEAMDRHAYHVLVCPLILCDGACRLDRVSTR